MAEDCITIVADLRRVYRMLKVRSQTRPLKTTERRALSETATMLVRYLATLGIIDDRNVRAKARNIDALLG